MAEINVNTPGARWRTILSGGAVAGAIGGVVLSVYMVIVGVARGENVWAGAKIAAYPFLGDRVMTPGFDAGAVALGLIDHFAVSIIWGILFALAAFGLSRRATVGLGAVWGIVVWLAMFYLVLPLVGAGNLVRGMPVGVAFIDHVIFGLTVGFGFLPFQRERRERAKLSRRWRLRPA